MFTANVGPSALAELCELSGNCNWSCLCPFPARRVHLGSFSNLNNIMPCVCVNGRFLLAEKIAGILISEAFKRKQANLPQSPLPGGQTLIAGTPGAPSHIPASRAHPHPIWGLAAPPVPPPNTLFWGLERAMTGQLRRQSS